MAHHAARGMHAAHPGTRVNAVLRHASAVARTLGICDALWLTLDVRVADIVVAALAGRGVISLSAVGVNAARGWVARFVHLDGSGCSC